MSELSFGVQITILIVANIIAWGLVIYQRVNEKLS